MQSYTTRKPREKNEYGHLFCSVEEYEQFKNDNQIVAYSYFNKNHYFSTKEQMYETDLYVVDFEGLIDLKTKIKDIKFIVFYLKTDIKTRIKRMKSRGDDYQKIRERLSNDTIMLDLSKYNYLVDYTLYNNSDQGSEVVDTIDKIILAERKRLL